MVVRIAGAIITFLVTLHRGEGVEDSDDPGHAFQF